MSNWKRWEGMGASPSLRCAYFHLILNWNRSKRCIYMYVCTCVCVEVFYLQSRYLWLARHPHRRLKPGWCTLSRTSGWLCPPPSPAWDWTGPPWLMHQGKREQLGQTRRRPLLQVLAKSWRALLLLLRHQEPQHQLLPEPHCGQAEMGLFESWWTPGVFKAWNCGSSSDKSRQLPWIQEFLQIGTTKKRPKYLSICLSINPLIFIHQINLLLFWESINWFE